MAAITPSRSLVDECHWYSSKVKDGVNYQPIKIDCGQTTCPSSDNYKPPEEKPKS